MLVKSTPLYVNTHHADELRQRHLDGDGDLLALVDGRSDQFVVALWTQQVVDQPLLCILCPAACGRAGKGKNVVVNVVSVPSFSL